MPVSNRNQNGSDRNERGQGRNIGQGQGTGRGMGQGQGTGRGMGRGMGRGLRDGSCRRAEQPNTDNLPQSEELLKQRIAELEAENARLKAEN